MKKLLVPLVPLALIAGCTADDPTNPELSAVPLFDAGGVPHNGIPYTADGDCTSDFNLIDPGTVKINKNGIRIERGVVAECPITGSLAGVIRFTRSSTLRNGDGPFTEWDGPVWGTTTIMIDEYFGETDFEGTFTGPYNTDWQNLLFGELRLNRRGTGDFQGLTTVGTGQAEFFGLIIRETGLIQGPQGRP